MTRAFLFDVDGTLTDPRQPMEDDFASFFEEFCTREAVYLVSGSDLKKIQEQVPENILKLCKGVFSSSGNQLNVRDELIYSNVFQPKDGFVSFLFDFMDKSNYPDRTGRHLELRPGMINFSIVGRNATNQQRKKYYNWDKKNQERKKLAVLSMTKFPDLDVKIGGEISVDIYPNGNDKRQAVSFLRNENPDVSIYFFGDRTDKDGNDYSVVVSLIDGDKSHTVKGFKETYKILNSYWENNNE